MGIFPSDYMRLWYVLRSTQMNDSLKKGTLPLSTPPLTLEQNRAKCRYRYRLRCGDRTGCGRPTALSPVVCSEGPRVYRSVFDTQRAVQPVGDGRDAFADGGGGA